MSDKDEAIVITTDYDQGKNVYALTMIVKAPENWIDHNDVETVIVDIIETATQARIIDAKTMHLY